MKYFKDDKGIVYAFEADGSQDHAIPTGLLPITEAEADLLRKPKLSKDQVWESIKAERDRRKAGGVKIGTKWYHTDADSRIQHLSLKDQARDLLAAGQPDTTRLQKLGQDVRWKTMDGSFIYLTVKHAFDIVAAVGDLDALAFTAAETHRVAMEASADPASYDFSAGWPATFPG
jgi:hypothetical protein